MTTTPRPPQAEPLSELREAPADAAKYRALHTPEVTDFMVAVEREALFQREKWGADGDAGKTDTDWFWLIGYLAGKAIRPDSTPEKQLHHIITTAAACVNWHAARVGAYTTMRPGIAEPASHALLAEAESRSQPPAPEAPTLKIGGLYNWKNQPERLVYVGLCEPRNGRWHQFELVSKRGAVWCEILDADLHRIEPTAAPEAQREPTFDMLAHLSVWHRQRAESLAALSIAQTATPQGEPVAPTLADVIDALNVFNPSEVIDGDGGRESWTETDAISVSALPEFVHRVGRAWYTAPPSSDGREPEEAAP